MKEKETFLAMTENVAGRETKKPSQLLLEDFSRAPFFMYTSSGRRGRDKESPRQHSSISFYLVSHFLCLSHSQSASQTSEGGQEEKLKIQHKHTHESKVHDTKNVWNGLFKLIINTHSRWVKQIREKTPWRVSSSCPTQFAYFLFATDMHI